jgi:hypothetical protein
MGVVFLANVVLVFSLLVPKSPCSHFSSKLPEWQLASGRFYIINLFGFVVGSLLKTVCTQAVVSLQFPINANIIFIIIIIINGFPNFL